MTIYTTRLTRWYAGAAEFLAVYRQYRRYHGIRYSLATAWNIVGRGLPF
jgi:hypothetical protein